MFRSILLPLSSLFVNKAIWKRVCVMVFWTVGFCVSAPCRDGAAWAQDAGKKEGITNETCFLCHSVAAGEQAIDAEKFQGSIHGSHRCTSCHTGISKIPHDLPLEQVTCVTCHRLETEIFLQSDHGKALKAGILEAASCRKCHGDPHELLNSRDPASSVFRGNIPQMCAQCHEQPELMAAFHLNKTAPVASYSHTIHGQALMEGKNMAAAVCTDCHGSHDIHASTNRQSKLNWQNIPKTCGKCHENILLTYLRSVHGQAVSIGKKDAPVCTDCHGEHSIESVRSETSPVYPSHVPETCGQCHAAERITTKYQLPNFVVQTYYESFHGLSAQLGSVKAANCASCHGTHDILPALDTRSSVHPDNLMKTCGKCHAGVSSQVAQGQIHSGKLPGKNHRFVGYVRWFYIVLIFLVIGGMLVHNGLDFFRKMKAHYADHIQKSGQLRMGLNERVQHAVLALSFIVLAYTGFALKFPQAWWAAPFVGRGDWRSLGHRLAAAAFCVLVVYHVWFVLCTKEGRRHLRDLLPRREDFSHFTGMWKYYFRKSPQRPAFGRYSYIEKMEYWALVWGSIIMVVTGALMLRESWFLKIFPFWFFDVVAAIHFYEAVLASLAIVIWHGYFVMFDPDEYPMKWTWISGLPSPSDEKHRKEETEEMEEDGK